MPSTQNLISVITIKVETRRRCSVSEHQTMLKNQNCARIPIQFNNKFSIKRFQCTVAIAVSIEQTVKFWSQNTSDSNSETRCTNQNSELKSGVVNFDSITLQLNFTTNTLITPFSDTKCKHHSTHMAKFYNCMQLRYREYLRMNLHNKWPNILQWPSIR